MTDTSRDQLGDRMKGFESVETTRRLDITLPVYARIDGRGFSKFTRGLRRPVDDRMSHAMIAATTHLVKNTGALIGYTQSDEISLGWHVDLDTNPLADMFFSGKIQKLSSVLAAMATAAFTKAILSSDDAEFRAYADKLPHFDCRIFNLPDRDELANAFLWRELDAQRNAVSMVAQTHFSHRELHGVNVKGMREKLSEIGIEFEGFPDFFKRGTFIRPQKVERPIVPFFREDKQGDTIGEMHIMAGGTGIRTVIEPIPVPPLLTITNRPDFIYGATPEVRVG